MENLSGIVGQLIELIKIPAIISMAASAISAWVSSTSSNQFLQLFKDLLNAVALNIGAAKNADDPR